ncbi:Transposase [Minicystis rosea]|nr:Transposase [Minicystis rosea]
MTRQARSASPTRTLSLPTLATRCGACGEALRADYRRHRTLATLGGVIRLHLQVRRCQGPACPDFLRPVHPEEEGSLALPHLEFGLDVFALVAALRRAERLSLHESLTLLHERRVDISLRTIKGFLRRHEALLSTEIADDAHLQRSTLLRGRVVLGIDGRRTDIGRETLWIVRDCLSGEPLRARWLSSAGPDELVQMLETTKRALPVPIACAVSRDERVLREAVATALPGVPHDVYHQRSPTDLLENG